MVEPDSSSQPSRQRPPRSSVAARLLARARGELEQQSLDDAERSLTNVLALAPNDPEATRLLGLVARQRGDPAKAVDCFRQVLAVWPDDSDLHTWLGVCLFSLGEVEEAIVHLRRACQLAPASAPARVNLGEALWRWAHADEAATQLREALELDPAHIPARLSLARLEAGMGRPDAARAEFREILRRAPDNANAWYALSMNTEAFDRADVEHLQKAFARDDLPTLDHELFGFSLAKALECNGEHARAFEVLQIANASQHRRMSWDAAGAHRFADALLDVFATKPPPPLDSQLGREAILIVGMPRSGSTLVEQILASHPQVEGANEIKDLRQVLETETQRRGKRFPHWVPDAKPEDWQRLGQAYLARTARWHTTRPRFTDKNLMNWYLVGAALAMLPAARVVVVRRDPVETCLACYRHCFTEEAGFACDLDDTADFCVGFLRLTRFWMDQYPDQVFDLEYETLVNHSEATIRRLLEFCELPFNPACIEFYNTPRAVLTPSAGQVHQPLRHDTARSARYGDKLAPLRQRLRDAGVLME